MRLLLLYLIAGIAGALGGCGAGAIMALTNKKTISGMQVISYIIIGMISGLFVFAFGYLFALDTDNPAVLSRWALLMGITVPISLFSHNMALSAVLKKFGFEIEFTLRRNKEERRERWRFIDDDDK